MVPARTSRVILHAIWLAPVSALPTLFVMSMLYTALSPGHASGPDAATGVLFLLAFAPFWVPAVALAGAVIGAVAGLAARLAARGGRWLQAGAGTLGGAGAGFVASLASRAGGWQSLQPFDVVGLATGAVTGGLAVLIASRSSAVPSPGLRWGAATATLAAITGLIGSYLLLAAGHWDAAEECASQLGVGESVVAVAGRAFPPQSWCVTEYAVEPCAPVWVGPVMVLALTAAALCALVATRHWWSAPARPWAVVVAALAVGVLGTAWAVSLFDPDPAPELLASTREELRNRPVPESPPPVTPTAPSIPVDPTAPPEVPADAAREVLNQLDRVASTAAGRTAVWPARLDASESPCELSSGATGVLITLTGRFTARDPGQVHGRAEMAELSRANERLAGHIVDAWTASGLLATGDVLHGEWWLASPTGSPVSTAHVGFTDGIGELRVTSYCARR